MSGDERDAQELRSETFGIRLTPTEKRGIRWLADLRGVSETDLVRAFGLDEVIARIVEKSDEMRAVAEAAWSGDGVETTADAA